MTATLNDVATVASLMMNLEKEALRLDAIRLAMKKDKFKQFPIIIGEQQM
jgi:hypothetical protein